MLPDQVCTFDGGYFAPDSCDWQVPSFYYQIYFATDVELAMLEDVASCGGHCATQGETRQKPAFI
jgi:hypothetical protein